VLEPAGVRGCWTGTFDTAEHLLLIIGARRSNVDQAAVYHLKILPPYRDGRTRKPSTGRADMPAPVRYRSAATPDLGSVQPNTSDRSTLDGRAIEAYRFPLMTDPEQQAAMDVLWSGSWLSLPTPVLLCLCACRTVAVQHPACTTRASVSAYAFSGPCSDRFFHRYRHANPFRPHSPASLWTSMALSPVRREPLHVGTSFWNAADHAVLIDCMRGRQSKAGDGDGRSDVRRLTYVSACDGLLLRMIHSDASVALNPRCPGFCSAVQVREAEDVIVSQQRFIAHAGRRDLSTFSDAQFDGTTFEAHPTGGYHCTWILKLQGEVPVEELRPSPRRSRQRCTDTCSSFTQAPDTTA